MGGRSVSIDPSKFHPINVADTCAVWNVLSSARLHAAAKEAHCDFCITSFVRYECLHKPRTSETPAETELMARLRREQERGGFKAHSCDIGDLQAIGLLESRKKLGKGELSSIAFAAKINQAVITDDQKARKLANATRAGLGQTTPHLFAWLMFKRYLGDSDKATVLSQHRALDGTLEPHFERAYELAMACLLNS